MREIKYTIQMALEMGFDVCVGGEDASRADTDFLLELLETIEHCGARRFRFADTVGVMEPFSLSARIARLRRSTGMELEMHAHDDLGLATANTLAAIVAGATHVNTTVHGLGERAGNAPLEEVVMALKHLHEIETGIDLSNYACLSTLVANASGRPVAWHKSLVGPGAFTHEAGIHVDGLIKDRRNYQGVDPAELGRNHKFVLGKHSGSRAILKAYDDIGMRLTHEQARSLVLLIRRHVMLNKQPPARGEVPRKHRDRRPLRRAERAEIAVDHRHQVIALVRLVLEIVPVNVADREPLLLGNPARLFGHTWRKGSEEHRGGE